MISVVMKTATALLTLASIFPMAAHAGEWSLDSCINYAVEHNLTVRMQQLRVDEGEMGITEAKDRFLPQVAASANQSFSFGRGLTSENTYANRNTTSTGWNVGLSLPLFQGTTEYKRLKIAKMSLMQYVHETEAAKDNITLNVISQYLQVLYSKEVVAAARSQAELSTFEVERQKALIEAGKVAEATLYDLEAVAAQDSLQIVTSENDFRTALVNLANLLQLKSIEGFDVKALPDFEPYIPQPEAVYASATGTNNSLLGARQALKVAGENIGLAKAGYLPTLNFSAGIGSNYYTVGGFKSDNFGQQMRNNLSKSLGFSLNIPIFDGFNTRNSVRRARLQELNARLSLEQKESDLYKEIQLAYYQAIGARDKYLTAEETLRKTRLSFESTRERFNLGRATQADYETAKNNLFRTEVSLIQAHYEYLIRYRILKFYEDPRG